MIVFLSTIPYPLLKPQIHWIFPLWHAAATLKPVSLFSDPMDICACWLIGNLTSPCLFEPLRTSALLRYKSKVIIKLLQNCVPDHHGTGSHRQKPITENSRTAHELSDKIKFTENGQDLTTWLAHESGHILRRQDSPNLDDLYLRSQRCGEVRFLIILIVLIHSINAQNVGCLHHQRRCSYLRRSWHKPQNSALDLCMKVAQDLCYKGQHKP